MRVFRLHGNDYQVRTEGNPGPLLCSRYSQEHRQKQTCSPTVMNIHISRGIRKWQTPNFSHESGMIQMTTILKTLLL